VGSAGASRLPSLAASFQRQRHLQSARLNRLRLPRLFLPMRMRYLPIQRRYPHLVPGRFSPKCFVQQRLKEMLGLTLHIQA